ncbi:MAG: hypothetical protein KF734_18255 [Saprospiraceae bacterium]|nr:hypothetical protein [Saprospiraceae bacterium]
MVVGNAFLKKSDHDYRRAVEVAEEIKAEYFAELNQTIPDPDKPGKP